MARNVATTQFPSNSRLQSTIKPRRVIRVLLVDDDPVILEELQEIIEMEGWVPSTATSVEDAMDILKNDRSIRVVVTDVHFGRGSSQANGIQFLSSAKEKFSDRALSYVVLSGDPDKFFCSKDEGAFKFLAKPLIPQRLIDTIDRAVVYGDGERGYPNAVNVSRRHE